MRIELNKHIANGFCGLSIISADKRIHVGHASIDLAVVEQASRSGKVRINK